MLDGELVFVPGDIPRRGVFAHWGKGSGSAKLELVFPGGRYGIRKRLVSADLIPLTEALPVLLTIEPGERAGRRAGLGMAMYEAVHVAKRRCRRQTSCMTWTSGRPAR